MGTTARVSQNLGAGRGQRARWSVTTMAAGRCNLRSGQILRRLHHGAHPRLRCALGINGSESFQPERQAPSVNGHIAFQDGPGLAWEYAPRSWAVLSEADRNPHLTLMVKVAAGLTFWHLRQPALRFPYRLTGLPAAWRVGSVHFTPDAGVLTGHLLYVAGTGGPDEPEVEAALARPGRSCPLTLMGRSQRRTINGIAVVISHYAGADGSPATLQVCAADADGLFLLISTFGQEQPGSVSIFRHSLRLLGRDPANWTTRPLG